MVKSVSMSEPTHTLDAKESVSAETDKKNARRVLTACAFLFFISSIFFIGLKRTDWFPWVGECFPNTKPGHFLAYCHSIRFGDYEHYAYYHGSEPEAIENVKKASVIFLGSSNTQFAFSTQAVSNYFEKTSESHYVLGFGHGAQSGVAKAVATKLALRPKLWVVNADPFFTGEMNATFKRIDKPNSDSFLPRWLQTNIHGEHSRKRWLQAEQSSRCDSSDAGGMWCQGGADTLHRNTINGHWSVENYRKNLQLPVGQNTTSFVENLQNYSTVAKEFMQALGIAKECLVITATPRTDTPDTFARQLAETVGSPYVGPAVEGLKTIDGFHLDPISSERWSQAFLQELAPHLARCI